MIYEITMKFNNDVDELLDILQEYEIDYEVKQIQDDKEVTQ